MAAEYQDPLDEVVCPYDPAHRVPLKTMQNHLIRCKKNHPEIHLVVCPYNARHHVPKKNLREHKLYCPDKDRALNILLYENSRKSTNEFKGNTDLPVYSCSDTWSSSEDWDEEISKSPIVETKFQNRVSCRTLVGVPSSLDQAAVNGSDDDDQLRRPYLKPQKSDVGQQMPSLYAFSQSMSGVDSGQAVGRGSAMVQSRIQGRGRAAGRGRALMLGLQLNNGSYNQITANEDGFPRLGGTLVQSGQVANGSPHALSLLLLGAGRGRGITFDSKTEMSSGGKAGVTVNKNVDSEAARIRDTKRLEKKLRQIEILENKANGGFKLSPEEEIKVKNKMEIVAALENLRVGGN